MFKNPCEHCSSECEKLKDGECPVGEDIVSNMCAKKKCEKCIENELCKLYNSGCRLDKEILKIESDIMNEYYIFDKEFKEGKNDIRKNCN